MIEVDFLSSAAKSATVVVDIFCVIFHNRYA
jgi:hypothetical protein